MALAVILDMDGLMLDTERISLRVWRQAAEELGYLLDDDLCDRMVGLNAPTNRAMLLSHFGAEFPVDRLMNDAWRRYRRCLDAEGVPHKPGLVSFLEFLDAERLPRAVATSTATPLARHKLEQAGVLRFFDVVVGGDQVQHGKPAPDIFLAAAGRLGCGAGDCVVLEDSGPGIRGAAAAGMIPILVPDGRGPTIETRRIAQFVVESLNDARTVIEQLIQHRAVAPV